MPIILPRPDNVRGRFGSYVTDDMFHIAERLQELDPHLYISALDEPINWHGQEYHFTISEICGDGVERFVMRVKELDGRVIQRCERMLRIPFEQRFAELEKIADKWEAEDKERQLNELYEKMGGNMWVQLERCGFIQRPTSYAKRNATARRHRNAAKALAARPAPAPRKLVLPPGVSA